MHVQVPTLCNCVFPHSLANCPNVGLHMHFNNPMGEIAHRSPPSLLLLPGHGCCLAPAEQRWLGARLSRGHSLQGWGSHHGTCKEGSGQVGSSALWVLEIPYCRVRHDRCSGEMSMKTALTAVHGPLGLPMMNAVCSMVLVQALPHPPCFLQPFQVVSL